MAINFNPLWDTMREKGKSTYDLKYKMKIGGGTYNRLKNNESVSTNTINDLCDFFDCDISDVMEYKNQKDIK